ncbi:hypothetical protein LTR53_014257 [Teratosphaeriaceae sp. CCFEE 6253]|nr:hypothetical protein LTR53_014257 [Teratosphaeriaceae sp. CCFEE 6253]
MASCASAFWQAETVEETDWRHAPVIPGQSIELPIDHFNPSDERVFLNRFWVNSTFYKPGGPVLFYDAGEQSYSHGDRRKFSGLAVLWEHRYYGWSLPYPIDSLTGMAPDGFEAYQYLTTEQALEDTVYFAQHFQPAGFSSNATSLLHPSHTPWIFIGGSYPGARAAFSRLRNPEVWYAAWSSSGAVQATIDMATYGEQVYQDIPANCSADIKAATAFMDATLEHGSEEQIAVVKSLILLASEPELCREVDNISDEELEGLVTSASKLSDFWTAWLLRSVIPHDFQYGWSRMYNTCDIIETYQPGKSLNMRNERTSASLRGLFDSIYSHERDGGTPSPEGISETYGPFAAFAAVLHAIRFWALVTEHSNIRHNNTTPTKEDLVSWAWQMCSEYGFCQVSNVSSPYNLMSVFINLDKWHAEGCDQIFGYPEMPSVPDVSLPNRYGGWTMTPSNVMFVNGAKDPWHTLSVQSTSAEIGAPNRITTQDIPACNQAPADDKVFGLVLADGYHCSDLGSGEHGRIAAALFAGEWTAPCARLRREFPCCRC